MLKVVRKVKKVRIYFKHNYLEEKYDSVAKN